MDGARSKTVLRSNSRKKAIILQLVEFGGRATLNELNSFFGFDVLQDIQNLYRDGWIQSTAKGADLPRRPQRLSKE